MGELLHLPHDLPVYKPVPWVRARVYKQGSWWTWDHDCAWSAPANGYPHRTQPEAFRHAYSHAERCR